MPERLGFVALALSRYDHLLMSETVTESASAQPAAAGKSMDDIVALCRRRGFIFQSSEIYGGINGFWDYGPLGTELKRNLKNAWWNDIVHEELIGPDGQPVEMVGLDTTIIMHPKVWVASGHVGGFNDPMVDDKETKQRFRADQLLGLFIGPAQPDDDKSIVALVKELAQNVLSAQWPERWTLAKTATGSWSECLQEFAASKRLGDYRVESARVESRFDETGEVGGGFELRVRGKDQQYYLARCLPLVVHFLSAFNERIPSPFTGKVGALTVPRQFNLMFETYVGAVRDEENKAYLRPETAQGIFVNFKNVIDTTRVGVPFGIAQQGKAFRNEVTPRNFTFRSREFEQMEIEFFIHPSTANEWYKFWRDSRFAWWQSIGLSSANLQLREHERDELAHYAKEGAGTSDIEYRFPFTAPGYGELEGVAHRADFDLKAHAEHSGLGNKLTYFDQDKNERYFPHVIEPSAGADRGTLALICEAYTPDETRPSKVFMKFHPRMAPVKAAIFPLVNKDGMPEVAEKLYRELRRTFVCQYDPKQSIGKRYARMDEAGTPYCFTIDGETLKDQTVTVRYRDTQQQERIGLDKVSAFLKEKIGA